MIIKKFSSNIMVLKMKKLHKRKEEENVKIKQMIIMMVMKKFNYNKKTKMLIKILNKIKIYL